MTLLTTLRRSRSHWSRAASIIFFSSLAFLTVTPKASAQAVAVTASLETNRLDVGGSTTLHVFAQIVPALRPSTDRIFSWYVDLLDPVSAVAVPDLAHLKKTTSDQDPATSSNGVANGTNQRGIYDTFLNLANAGRDNPVELFSVPIKAVAAGHARFSVQPGTGVPALGADFIVAPTEAVDPLLGADYTAATADLDVITTAIDVQVLINRSPLPSGPGSLLTLTFPVLAGHSYTVEAAATVVSTNWQALPNPPHNTGSVTDTNTLRQRFYRVRVN